MYNTITTIQNEVVEILKGKGYEAEATETIRNGVTLKGVVVRSKGLNPVAWIDEKYTAERIAEGLIMGLSKDFNYKGIGDFESIKKEITEMIPDILQRIEYRGLVGHSFYFYLVPFEKLETNRTEILAKVVE